MPTYEYECLDCGHKFDKFQQMVDEPLKQCPKCKGKVKRLIGSGSGIIFKGTGFYATDYRKGAPEKAPEKSPAKKPSECGAQKSCDKPKRCCEK